VDPVATDPGFDAAEDRATADSAGPALARALAALLPEQRDVLLLFAWADLSYGEIARALSCPVGTVRSRLARARQRLRELLAASGQVNYGDEPLEGSSDE
jgi:RNA polymerase sigma factor (sigma-70 family)